MLLCKIYFIMLNYSKIHQRSSIGRAEVSKTLANIRNGCGFESYRWCNDLRTVPGNGTLRKKLLTMAQHMGVWCHPVTVEIAGSNPVVIAKIISEFDYNTAL